MNVAATIANLSTTEQHPDLPGPELLPSRLMRATAAVLPVTGAGISAYVSYRQQVPMGASDDTAAVAERLQFTVGEGPCLTAHAKLEPVHASSAVMAQKWPAFYGELVTRTPYRAIVAVPITDRRLGCEAVIDLYYDQLWHSLDAQAQQHVDDAINVVTALLIAGSGLDDPRLPGPVWLNHDSARSRSLVWTAIGLINMALDMNDSDALSVLRGYAYSRSTTIDDIALNLTTGKLPVDDLKI